jgi:AcrR family transcriptional regulator
MEAVATVEPIAAPRRGRPRSTEVDEAVLAATVELAGEAGVSRLSMDDVAVRAKVSKATIYRRWVSKEALVLDALRNAMVPIEEVDTGSLRGDLEHYLRELVNRFHSGKMRDVLPHLIGVATHDANLQCSLDDYMQTRRVPLRLILDRAFERGELSADTDLDVLIDVIIGPFTYRKLLTHSVIDNEFTNKVLDLVLPNV